MLSLRIGLTIAMTMGFSWAQQFEVASVKPSGPKSVRNSEGGPGTRDPGRYTFTSMMMVDLVATAYGVEYFQVAGKMPLDREQYDVAVTMPPDTTKEQFQAMLRNLLTERFHLKVHTESKEFPAYELVVATSGFMPTSADPDAEGFPQLPEGRPQMAAQFTTVGAYVIVKMRARQQTMAGLTKHLRQSLDRPVVDRTGITGAYDFTLEFARELTRAGGDSAPEPATAPSVFTAVQKQLGLQLVDKKVPFDVLTVESFDKVPTGN